VECKWKLDVTGVEFHAFKFALTITKTKEGSHTVSSVCSSVFLLLGRCLLINLGYFQNLTRASYKPQSGLTLW
jgi:hypothetical protein